MNYSGFLLIDKEVDWTSHDVVAVLRKTTSLKKIGHAGTLDPFATGLLIVAIGRAATRRIDEFKNLAKTYRATIRLGAISDTQDKTGTIEEKKVTGIPSKKDVKQTLQEFTGKQEQIPPMYSAKKVKGKKLYELARKGVEIERKANRIEIYKIKLKKYTWPFLEIEVSCSPGTYIRTLANDIGEKLETGGLCQELKRTKIGKYNVKKAKTVDKITATNWPKLLLEQSKNM